MTSFLAKNEQTDSIYVAILEDIMGGKIQSGQRLKISELAKRFGTSASPVRETLRLLQGEGFIEIHPNRGATVKAADPTTIQNIFEVLQLLEPYFVTWFAEYAQPNMLTQLNEVQNKIKAIKATDLFQFRKLDFEFHGLICKYHYNNVAIESWNRLRTALIVHTSQYQISNRRIAEIIIQHDALIEAFEQNDVVSANEIIKSHVSGSFNQLSQQMRIYDKGK